MNKRDLADMVAYETGISRSRAAAAVNVVFETIAQALRDGGVVRVSGFGRFEVRERKARTGRNPRTGEPVAIPPTLAPAFQPSKVLKEQVNG